MVVMPVVFLIFGWLGSYLSDPNTSGFLGGVALLGPVCSAPFSLAVGYIFVLIGLLLYKVFDKFGFIKDESES